MEVPHGSERIIEKPITDTKEGSKRVKHPALLFVLELYCHWVFDWIALTAIAADAGREDLAATELMLPYR